MSDSPFKAIGVGFSYDDLAKNFGEVVPCNCIGPRNGEPFCRCMMANKNLRERKMLTEGIEIGGKRYRLVPEPPPTEGMLYFPYPGRVSYDS